MTPSADDVNRFARAVEARLGIRVGDRASGLPAIIARRSASRHETTADYLRHLDDPDPDELRALAAEVSVGETYFFRHAEQFHAFGDLVTALVASRGRVRVLSAGCSSGEEPYTLAMVAHDRIDPRAIAIHAIDVNPMALSRARRGHYSRWSLRATPPEHEQRWFSRHGRDVVLAQTIRDAVTFAEANLVDRAAIPAVQPWDVIFCRNVVMYFADAMMRTLVARLAGALAPGGYLFLGHAEALRAYPPTLELCRTHGTFYYRRVGAASPVREPDRGWIDEIAAAAERVRTMVDGALAAPTPAAAPFDAIRAMVCEERFTDAQRALRSLPAAVAAGPDAQLLHAIVLAQTGHEASARAACEALLASGEHRASAHYLLSICERDTARAEHHAREALRCDAQFAMAAVQLAFVARRRGDRVATADGFARAIALLEADDGTRLALFAGGFSRAALVELCRGELAKVNR